MRAAAAPPRKRGLNLPNWHEHFRSAWQWPALDHATHKCQRQLVSWSVHAVSQAYCMLLRAQRGQPLQLGAAMLPGSASAATAGLHQCRCQTVPAACQAWPCTHDDASTSLNVSQRLPFGRQRSTLIQNCASMDVRICIHIA